MAIVAAGVVASVGVAEVPAEVVVVSAATAAALEVVVSAVEVGIPVPLSLAANDEDDEVRCINGTV